MAEPMKYFSFHKHMDFERGFFEHMQCMESGIEMNGNTHGKSVFISRLLDAKEEQLQWHRMTMETSGSEAVYRISLYTSDGDEAVLDGVQGNITNIIRNGEITVEKKMECFRPFLKKRVVSCKDIWLHEVRGRYLWFVIEIFPQGAGKKGCFGIHEIMIYFPGKTWLHYLPDLYEEADREHGFLERYLGIFQTIYEDFDEAIRKVPQQLWIDAAQKEFLYFLASLLDWKDIYAWSDEKLRILLRHVVFLYRMRGTKQALAWLIELLVDEKPYILEYYQLSPFRGSGEREKLLLRLYGNDPYVCNIFLSEAAVPTEKEYKTVLKVMDEVRPAHMQNRLIVLKPYIFLDEHSYLGVNSVLGYYQDAALDGVMAVPFAVLGE